MSFEEIVPCENYIYGEELFEKWRRNQRVNLESRRCQIFDIFYK